MIVPPAISARYRAYLDSDGWRRRRNRRLRLAGYTCSRCGSKRSLEVHHNTYERLGKEWDQDLDVLCRDCHEGHHVAQIIERPERLYLAIAEEVIAAEPFASIADLSAAVSTRCVQLKIKRDGLAIARALSLLTNAVEFNPPQHARVVADRASGRPASHAEARELLRRLNAAPKRMPSTVSSIDIYGPVEHEHVEHDRY